jgi:hypothetical protein
MDARTKRDVAVGAGGAVLGALVVTILPAIRVRPVGLTTPATPAAPSPGTTTVPGISTLGPAPAQPATATPSSSPSAPTVSDLQITASGSGTFVLTWTGTLVASWVQADGTSADNIGYDLYLRQGSVWKLLQVEVYPPLTVSGLKSGDVLGVAPVYALSDGTTIGGAISAVTVP